MAKAPMNTNTGLEEALEPDEQAALDAEQKGVAPEQEEVQQQAEQELQPAKEPPPEKGKDKKVPDHVPYQRFQEVNAERTQAMREAAELREKWARLEERARLAQEAEQRIQQAQQQAKGPQRPDEAIDPVGAQLWDRDQQLAALNQRLEQIQQGLGQTAQQVQQGAQFQEFSNWLTSDVQQFRGKKSDYDQAAAHAQQRMYEWGTQVIGAPPEEVQNIVNGLSAWAAQRARQNGRSAAEAFYGLAQTMGFTGNTPPPPAANTDRAKLKLEQARAGQAQQGLTRVPAQDEDNVNWTTMGAKELAEMDETEFAQRWNDPKERVKLERLFQRLEMGA